MRRFLTLLAAGLIAVAASSAGAAEASKAMPPKAASSAAPPKAVSSAMPPKAVSSATPPKAAPGAALPKPASSAAPLRTASSVTPPKAASSAGDRLSDCAAAERGDPQAAFRLAKRYLFGNGVPRDRRLGMAWLRAAASNGHPEARRQVNYIPGRMGHIRPWCRSGGGPMRGLTPPPAEIVKLVNDIAAKHGLDPALVLAVIQAESAYRTDAVSPKDAAGLMQLIPETAERFAVHDIFDPAENIRGGVKYLRWLLSYFQGDVTLALAGYNAGEKAVDRYKGIPPYEETRNYVRIIRQMYGAERHPFDPRIAEPSPTVVRQAAELSKPNKG